MSEIKIRLEIGDNPAWPSRKLEYRIYYGQIVQIGSNPPLFQIEYYSPLSQIVFNRLLDKRFVPWLTSIQTFFQIESNGWIYNSGQYDISSMSLDKAYEKIIAERNEKQKILDELITDYIRFQALLKLEKEERKEDKNEKLD